MNIITVDVWLKRLQINSINIDTDPDSWTEAFQLLLSPLCSGKSYRVWANEGPSKARALHPVLSAIFEDPEHIYEDVTIESELHTFGYIVDKILSKKLSGRRARTAMLLMNHALPRLASALLEPWGHEALLWLVERYALSVRFLMGGDEKEIECLVPHSGLVPAPESSGFIGRNIELSRVSTLLIEGFRMVTITGPGGIGKTRLAKESMPASVKVVNLKLVTSSGRLIDAIRGTLGLLLEGAVRSGIGPVEALASHLPDLLVLDNADHLDQEALAMLHDLLEAAPACQMVITSREPLGLAGEAEIRLAPLTEQESLLLIDSLARRHGKNAGDINASDLVKRAAGNPLALEKGVSGGELEKLPRRLQLLMAGLATFAASWSDEEAAKVLGSEIDEWDQAQLLDAHLIGMNSTGRYAMMDPTREDARKLEAPDLRPAHAAYFEALAIENDTEKLAAASVEVWAALSYITNSGEGDRASAMAVSLSPWARSTGQLDTLEGALREVSARVLNERSKAEVSDALGRLLVTAGRFTESLPELHSAMAYWESQDELAFVGRSAINLAISYQRLAHLTTAEIFARRAVSIFSDPVDTVRLPRTLTNLAQVLGELERLEEAALVQAKALSFTIVQSEIPTRCLNLVESLLHLGMIDDARVHLATALASGPTLNEQARAKVLSALLDDPLSLPFAWEQCKALDTIDPFWQCTVRLIEKRLAT